MLEQLDKNILKLLYNFLDEEDNILFKGCSKYLNKIIGSIYFKYKGFNIKKIINQTEFRYLVYKYKLLINVDNVNNLFELAYLRNFNVNSLRLTNNFNDSYYEYIFNDEDTNTNGYKTLNQLVFSDSFNQPINKYILPIRLEKIAFGSSFNQPIEESVLPPLLKDLVFGHDFNQPIGKNILPTTLINLKFGEFFNQPIDKDALPTTLEQLIFGNQFNQLINNLSAIKLKVLHLGYFFNQPITNLPSSLMTLDLGHTFKQSLEHVLPILLKNLEFQTVSINSLKNLPSNLEYLYLGYNFDKPLYNIKFPLTLKTLVLSVKYKRNLFAMKYLCQLPLDISFIYYSGSEYPLQKILLNSINTYTTNDIHQRNIVLKCEVIDYNNKIIKITILTYAIIELNIFYLDNEMPISEKHLLKFKNDSFEIELNIANNVSIPIINMAYKI
jgi:hypothetical protein